MAHNFFLKCSVLCLSPGTDVLCRLPACMCCLATLLLALLGRGEGTGGSAGAPRTSLPRPEKSSAWSAGGGNKLLPNQPRSVAGEELQPPIYFPEPPSVPNSPSVLRWEKGRPTTTMWQPPHTKGSKSKPPNFSFTAHNHVYVG